MITDQIGDLLTRIRNATLVEHATCRVNYSKFKEEIVKILLAEGFITNYEVINPETVAKKQLQLFLKYKNHVSAITKIIRISKPGLRIHTEAKKLPVVLNGLGIAIVSTSKGVMTARAAKKLQTGGEVVAYVW